MADRALPRVNGAAVAQLGLRIVAEAGWITVVYALLCVVPGHHPPILGLVEFILFVAAGVFVGGIARRQGDFGAVLLIGAVFIGGALGWLASPDVRELLRNPNLAFNFHLAGWICGVAVLRGSLVSTGPRGAAEIERMLRNVPFALAALWIYGTLAARPDLLLPFAVSALWGTLAFLSAAVVSIGFSRLDTLHAGLADTAQRRGWRWLVLAIGFGIVPIAVPIAVLAGIPLVELLAPVGGILQFFAGIVIVPFGWLVYLLIELLRPFVGPFGELLDELANRSRATGGDVGTTQPDELFLALAELIGFGLWMLTVAFVLLAIYLGARRLLRRDSVADADLDMDDTDLERAFAVPPPAPRAAPKRGRRRSSPRDAVAAYLGAIGELERHPELARLPNETPAAHATRVREAGATLGPDLARLAADYQLARYAEATITQPENRRALSRYQRIRRLVRIGESVPGAAPGSAPGVAPTELSG